MSTENPSFFERANNWVRNSVSLRLVTIGILILLLLIPVALIQDLIREREDRQMEAINEVSSKWGAAQTLKGLVLTVPYKSFSKVLDNEKTAQYHWEETKMYAHFLPGDLEINGEVLPEKRYRGIYEVIVYNAKLNLKGNFSVPDFESLKIPPADILWDEAFLSLGLSDLRSIQQSISVNWNGEKLLFNPGVLTHDVIESGISAPLPAGWNNKAARGEFNFNCDVNFNGSTSLDFIPLGKTTKVELTSPWQNPKFDGAFLPDDRKIDSKGFTSTWDILHLNRPYPQSFTGSAQGINESSFGVQLVVTLDEYQKSERSAKYAVMFIALTFLVFFFIQVINGIRIHPIQYLMVGMALCVFYTLLIALSEHISFMLSYVVAALAIVGLITLYAHAVFKNKTLTGIIGGILSMLYLFIFSIIQMEDYALLMGSIGLFLVLSVVMYLSRKINWYQLKS